MFLELQRAVLCVGSWSMYLTKPGFLLVIKVLTPLGRWTCNLNQINWIGISFPDCLEVYKEGDIVEGINNCFGGGSLLGILNLGVLCWCWVNSGHFISELNSLLCKLWWLGWAISTVNPLDSGKLCMHYWQQANSTFVRLVRNSKVASLIT